MSEQRHFLNVPFAEKGEAKALGARFDPEVKQWFIPNGHKSPEVFVRWELKEATWDSLMNGSGEDAHEHVQPPHWMDPREYAPSQEEIQAMLDSFI